mmetsp:Transcript_30100/g.89278  ORF Transcript_30100/g.89278 Transcript_30100/m.89278 type:complete len:399 (+) Transcript_30100:500-1696(+)
MLLGHPPMRCATCCALAAVYRRTATMTNAGCTLRRMLCFSCGVPSYRHHNGVPTRAAACYCCCRGGGGAPALVAAFRQHAAADTCQLAHLGVASCAVAAHAAANRDASDHRASHQRATRSHDAAISAHAAAHAAAHADAAGTTLAVGCVAVMPGVHVSACVTLRVRLARADEHRAEERWTDREVEQDDRHHERLEVAAPLWEARARQACQAHCNTRLRDHAHPKAAPHFRRCVRRVAPHPRADEDGGEPRRTHDDRRQEEVLEGRQLEAGTGKPEKRNVGERHDLLQHGVQLLLVLGPLMAAVGNHHSHRHARQQRFGVKAVCYDKHGGRQQDQHDHPCLVCGLSCTSSGAKCSRHPALPQDHAQCDAAARADGHRERNAYDWKQHVDQRQPDLAACR